MFDQFKKQQGIHQLENLKKHLEAGKAIDLACTTLCFNEKIAGDVDWMLWNLYVQVYVPGQYKQPMEIIERLKMMVFMSLMDVAALQAHHRIVDAYSQLDKQHASIRDISLGLQDLLSALEQINVYPMYRSKTAERNRVRIQQEKNAQRRASNNG
jgi:hypothetical protein